MSDLKLFDGAKVKLRNGETDVIRHNPVQEYPWQGVGTGYTWTQSGRSFDDSVKRLQDIVEVLNPEDCPDSASQPEVSPGTCDDPNQADTCYVLHWRHDHECISGVIPRILSQSEVDLIEMVLEAVVPVRDVEIVKVDRG